MNKDFIPYEGYFYTIPAKLVEISPNPYIPLLYGLIMSLTHKEGYCWASNEFLAQKLKVSISSLKRHLKWLEEYKFIKRSINQEVGNLRKIYLGNIPVTETIKEIINEKDVKITLVNSKNNYTPRFTHDPTSVHPRPDPSVHPRPPSIKEESNIKNKKLLCPISKKSDVKDEPSSKETIRKEEKYTPKDLELAKYQLQKLKEIHPKMKAPKIDKWAKEFRLMREQDERSELELRQMIDMTYKDSFWRGVVASPSNLRKNFDSIALKVKTLLDAQKFNFNRKLAFETDKDIRRKFDGLYELQDDYIYVRGINERIEFTLPASEFVKKIKEHFKITFTLDAEEIRRYG